MSDLEAPGPLLSGGGSQFRGGRRENVTFPSTFVVGARNLQPFSQPPPPGDALLRTTPPGGCRHPLVWPAKLPLRAQPLPRGPPTQARFSPPTFQKAPSALLRAHVGRHGSPTPSCSTKRVRGARQGGGAEARSCEDARVLEPKWKSKCKEALFWSGGARVPAKALSSGVFKINVLCVAHAGSSPDLTYCAPVSMLFFGKGVPLRHAPAKFVRPRQKVRLF